MIPAALVHSGYPWATIAAQVVAIAATLAVMFVIVLGICVALRWTFWALMEAIEALVRLARVSKAVVWFVYDKHGRKQAMTQAEYEEELKRREDEWRENVQGFWVPKVTALERTLVPIFVHANASGDPSMYPDDMTREIVDDTLRELGVNVDVPRTLVNRKDEDAA